jgi:integrase
VLHGKRRSGFRKPAHEPSPLTAEQTAGLLATFTADADALRCERLRQGRASGYMCSPDPDGSRPMSPYTVSKYLTAQLRAVGVDRGGAHVLRHSAAFALLPELRGDDAVRLVDLSRALGHSTTVITQRYLRTDEAVIGDGFTAAAEKRRSGK